MISCRERGERRERGVYFIPFASVAGIYGSHLDKKGLGTVLVAMPLDIARDFNSYWPDVSSSIRSFIHSLDFFNHWS